MGVWKVLRGHLTRLRKLRRKIRRAFCIINSLPSPNTRPYTVYYSLHALLQTRYNNNNNNLYSLLEFQFLERRKTKLSSWCLPSTRPGRETLRTILKITKRVEIVIEKKRGIKIFSTTFRIGYNKLCKFSFIKYDRVRYDEASWNILGRWM